MTHFRAQIAEFMNRPIVINGILAVIIFNAVILGLQTWGSLMARAGGLIDLLDQACLAVFVAEMIAKMIGQGLIGYFKRGWNIFDFLVVGISLVPGAQGFSVLRALRVLRVLRVLSIAPSLRRVVEGFVTALPGMASVFVLMSIIFYIGSVMATKLFGADFPEWFGTLGASAYSLFQIMTLESWSMGIVRPVMAVHPHAWAFFVPFIMTTTFAVVNLLVGLIVNSMQEANSEESDKETDVFRDTVLERLAAIEKHLAEK
ncbi:ion transporter [Frigidibacter sp. ROC022]|uniref:ion transporter n=1 Tax=Frigidibacter sp. ROC022 TaxID=2971796 RepID=UPI00215B5C17|nr:ion transporter [Frigidibacter sp. ROC022]MCR8724446.1 ion transporter [Frigidibacter sp. ROC022]